MPKSLLRRLALALRTPKLSTIVSGLFVALSIPILIFILAYNYYRTSQTITATLQEDVRKASEISIETIDRMIHGVAARLGVLAQVAAIDPDFFRQEQSRDVLYRVVVSLEEIDAAYVSFEDGYHRVVTRIDDDRRRSDPKIPATANWHSSYIDDFSAGERRERHRTFFDKWGHGVGGYSFPTTMDVRILAGYPEAKQSRALAVTDPAINPDTGSPIIFVRVPIIRGDEFIGCATANVTLNVLSRFLATHRVSTDSTTIIADAANGRIIAASERSAGIRMVDNHLQIASLENMADADTREAYRLQVQTKQDHVVFNSPRDGREISASFARFSPSSGQTWQAIILTPTDDFIGPLKHTNRQMALIIVVLMVFELVLIQLLSRRLSKPIENISNDLKSIERLSFKGDPSRPSKIREIVQLQSAAGLLRNSLQSFSSFAPVELVRELIESKIPLRLGVERRRLTVLFSDLENFSTQAERLTPDDLLAQISLYFEQVSSAISQDQGTVDKFIGDGVMAFWGAPVSLPDTEMRACSGALRASRRMEAINVKWRAEGRPALRLRIGLHSAEVLVGNVGSSERFSYTVMGDGVNVAARLEGTNKNFGTTICISDSVFDAVAPKIVARPLRRVQVKGRAQAFMVYELLGMVDGVDPELRARPQDELLCEMTWNASRHFERGDFTEAARCYKEILRKFPDDAPAKSMFAAASTSDSQPFKG
jgi:adenylate cyclase